MPKARCSSFQFLRRFRWASSARLSRPTLSAMEAQSFGVALSYGGPYCGVIAAKEQYVRKSRGASRGRPSTGQGIAGSC